MDNHLDINTKSMTNKLKKLNAIRGAFGRAFVNMVEFLGLGVDYGFYSNE